MPLSYIEYTTGLGAKTYNVPINYISINDIGAIGYDGNEYNELTISSRSAANKQITLTTAPSSSFEKIRIFRSTTQAQLVDFQSGSRLSESDLDTAYQQALFVAQEIAEDANTSQFQGLLNAGLMGGTSLANFASEDLSSQVNGTSTVFTISNFEVLTTAQEAYRVTIDGIMQSPTDAYALSANPSRITFTSAPPSGSKVIIVTAASAASSSTVDNDTIGLKVVNGQSKIFIKNKGVDSLQIATDAINHEKIEDKAVRSEHLSDELSTGITKAINSNTYPAKNSTNLITSGGVYSAIADLNIGNLDIDAFKAGAVRKASEGTAHGSETELTTAKYVKKVADEVLGNVSGGNPTIIKFNFNDYTQLSSIRGYLAKVGKLYDHQNLVTITDDGYKFSLSAGKYLITMFHQLIGGDFQGSNSGGAKIDFCVYTGGTISTSSNTTYLELGNSYSNYTKIDDLSTSGTGSYDNLSGSFAGNLQFTNIDVQNISSTTKYSYVVEGSQGSKFNVLSYARIEPLV